MLIGSASSGLHANGYSLVRAALLDRYALDATPPGLGRPLADELLEPCVIYAPEVLAFAKDGLVHAAAHITGGGFIENVPRALPPGLGATIRSGSWPEPPIFELLRRVSGASETDMFSTFNMGVGMVLVVDPENVAEILRRSQDRCVRDRRGPGGRGRWTSSCPDRGDYLVLVTSGYVPVTRSRRTPRRPRSCACIEKGWTGLYRWTPETPYLPSGMETTTDTLDHSVLVVDDEPQVVWVLQYSLEAEGYTTLSARDGAAALEAVDLFHPRLMLLDIMMPTLDGWSVLEEIGKLPDAKRPRVVIVSALSSLRDRARAAELGADAFCPKPFNVEDLIGVVHDLEDLDDLDALTGVSDFPAS